MSTSTNLTGGPNWQPEPFPIVETRPRVVTPEQGEGFSKQLPLDSGCIQNMKSRHGREAMRRFLLIFDLSLVWGSAAVAMLLPAHLKSVTSGDLEPAVPKGSAAFLLFFSVLIVLLARTYSLYEIPWKKSLQSDLGLIAKSVVFSALITAVCNYLLHVRVAPTRSIALTIVSSWIALSAWRTFIRSQSISGLTGVRNILIVGCGPNGELLRRHLEQNPHIGYVFKGYIDRREKGRPPDPSRNKEEADILGPAEQLPAIVRKHFIDEVFISVPSDRHLVKQIARHAIAAGLGVRVVPDMYDGLAKDQSIEYVGNFATMTLNQHSIPTLQLFAKRLFDIAISATLLILLAPFILLIAVIIKLDSKGPALYIADRIGRKGQKFRCYKLRTMVSDADQQKAKLRTANERKGPTFKIENDPRVTMLGHWLRKVSLDELPQLWNVLRGDMSLVGPRPHPVDDCALYTLEHLRRLDVTPGLTGLWQVTARRDPSFETNVALDLEYIVNWSLGLDCRILLKTIGVVLAGTGQ